MPRGAGSIPSFVRVPDDPPGADRTPATIAFMGFNEPHSPLDSSIPSLSMTIRSAFHDIQEGDSQSDRRNRQTLHQRPSFSVSPLPGLLPSGESREAIIRAYPYLEVHAGAPCRRQGAKTSSNASAPATRTLSTHSSPAPLPKASSCNGQFNRVCTTTPALRRPMRCSSIIKNKRLLASRPG